MKIRDSSAGDMEFCGVFVWRKVWKYYHFPLSKFRFRFVNAASLTWSGIYYGFFLYLIAFFLHRSHSITSKIWVQFPVFKPEFLEEHTKSWLWPTDILNHWYCSIIAGRKHVDYKVPLFLGWKRKINSWQKKRGQNWIIVTQHKMFRSSSFQERKIFSQL